MKTFCQTTGKRQFPTKLLANRALTTSHAEAQARGGKCPLKRAYECVDCGKWHLTSMKLVKHKRLVSRPREQMKATEIVAEFFWKLKQERSQVDRAPESPARGELY